MRLAFLFFSLGFSAMTWANVAESIAAIQGLLSEGKKVSIIVIDMQEVLNDSVIPAEYADVVGQQKVLISRFSKDENVYFIEVKIPRDGNTIEPIAKRLNNTINKRVLYKDSPDAFTSQVANYEGIATESENVINEPLTKYLSDREVSDLFVMGRFDHDCVRATVEGAIEEAGLNVIVDRDLNILFTKDTSGDFAVTQSDRATRKYDALLDQARISAEQNGSIGKLTVFNNEDKAKRYFCKG